MNPPIVTIVGLDADYDNFFVRKEDNIACSRGHKHKTKVKFCPECGLQVIAVPTFAPREALKSYAQECGWDDPQRFWEEGYESYTAYNTDVLPFIHPVDSPQPANNVPKHQRRYALGFKVVYGVELSTLVRREPLLRHAAKKLGLPPENPVRLFVCLHRS